MAKRRHDTGIDAARLAALQGAVTPPAAPQQERQAQTAQPRRIRRSIHRWRYPNRRHGNTWCGCSTTSGRIRSRGSIS